MEQDARGEGARRQRSEGRTALSPFDGILGESEGAERIRSFGRRAAEVDAPVLITGETGTGKGVLARAIHRASARARAPFVAVNCAGIPESLLESEFFGHDRGAFTGAQQAHRGLMEQAHRGTLFLDEVGELALAAQAKLLTALEEGEFRRVGGERAVQADVRLVAATGVELERAVATGRFRRDLYHRLLVLALHLPPLRERPEDIPLLARHFLAGLRERYGPRVRRVDPPFYAYLVERPWPGNVRQLAHALEAAVLACEDGTLRRCHLPCTVRDAPSPSVSDVRSAPFHGAAGFAVGSGAVGAGGGGGAPVGAGRRDEKPGADSVRPRVREGGSREASGAGRYSFFGPPAEERRRIQDALRRWRGNKTRAAAELGMARNTLRAKLRRHGLGEGA